MCARAGLASVGTVAVDGTKLHANAALGANRAYPAIRAEVERMLGEGAAIDAAEDELYGEARGDELPAELADPARGARGLSRSSASSRPRTPRAGRHSSRLSGHAPSTVSGPAAIRRVGGQRRPMRTRWPRRGATRPTPTVARCVTAGCAIQGYNAQVVANEHQVILAAQLTNERRRSGPAGTNARSGGCEPRASGDPGADRNPARRSRLLQPRWDHSGTGGRHQRLDRAAHPQSRFSSAAEAARRTDRGRDARRARHTRGQTALPASTR